MRHATRILPPRVVRRRGSTLVEVLVSISILATAAVLLTQSALRGLDESALANRRAKAFLLAQDRMEDILANRADLAAYEVFTRRDYAIDDTVTAPQLYFFKPRSGDDYAAYRWRWEVNPVENRTGLREVTVWVHWQQYRGGGYGQHTRLKTYVAVGPDTPAEPAEKEGDPE